MNNIAKKRGAGFNVKFNIKYLPPIAAVSIAIFGIVIFGFNAGFLGNFLLLALLVGIVPYFMMSYLEYQRIKIIEDQLPIFLLDLAETQKTGVMLPDAFRQLSKVDYSKLTPEIKTVSNQISWGLTIEEALTNMAKRLKRSELVDKAIRIIIESYNSGGDVIRTMETISNDLIALREIEKDKRNMMFQQVMVMYSIYFIFIGIIIALSKTLVPMLTMDIQVGGAVTGIFAFQDPCMTCATSPQPYCISCTIYTATCTAFPQLGTGAACYYRALFMLMAVVQGIFSGLVAGQIGENSAIAGIKHSLIMTLSGFAIIMLLLFLGQL